jgi:transcriptional regulator GlxA family with amidase domain
LIPVLFLLLPNSLLLDWAGPAEALRIADQAREAQGLPPRFELRFVGPVRSPPTSLGLALTNVEPLPRTLPPGAWLVLVGAPGTRFDPGTPEARKAIDWLRTLRPLPAGARLVTICSGALLAAHGGLLDGCRATTHHQHLDELREAAPACEVVGNRVFVLDGPVASSAGITTGFDLALHLIAQECGPALAAHVAQTMVLALRRGPQDPELSPFLAHRSHLHAALHRVQDAVAAEPQREWTVPAMARIAHTSTRHLARVFMEHAGVAPLAYLRRMRLSVAQAALACGHNVTQAAAMAGFSSDTQLRRAWHQVGLAGTPSDAASLQNSEHRRQ